MKVLLTKLFSFLIPAAIAIGFLIWWFSPTQSVIRTSKAILDTFEVRALTMGSRDEQTIRVREYLAPNITISGPNPFPNESLERAEFIDLHQRYQAVVISSRINSSNYSVRFTSKNQVIVLTEVQADLQMAGGRRSVMRYQIIFHLEKVQKQWLLTEIRGTLR